jgi:hypothetical protein
VTNQSGGEWMGANKNSAYEPDFTRAPPRIQSMNPISLVHLHSLLLSSPHSHWSATGPRRKTQPTTTQHTQRKHTRHGRWHLKPARPVSETGQTTSVGLCLTHAGETGQTIWQIGQAGFVQKLPKTPLRPKPQEPFHLWTKQAIARQRLPCSKTLLNSPQG